VALDGLEGVIRTTWTEPAGWGERRCDPSLVQSDYPPHERLEDLTHLGRPVRAHSDVQLRSRAS